MSQISESALYLNCVHVLGTLRPLKTMVEQGAIDSLTRQLALQAALGLRPTERRLGQYTLLMVDLPNGGPL